MRTAAVALILSTACAAILTPLIRRWALRLNLLDHALTARKIHGRPIPRLGGIAIVIAFYAPLVGLLIFRSDVGAMFLAERDHVLGLFIGGPLIALLGIYDDLHGAGARKKFAVQFLVAGAMYAFGFRVVALANPFGSPLALGWLALPFTLLWFVGVINAMNLIDGLDGLAGGVALVAVATTFAISVERGHPLMILFCAALAGAIVGFLFYNFNPASIFMGDTGSMFLGFVLAASALRTHQKSATAVAVLIPAIALGLPILDTLLAMSRRAVRGQPIFQADREHIHHRLLATGLTHRQTVLVLYGTCVVFGAVSLILTFVNSGAQTAGIIFGLAGISFFFLRRLGYMRFEAGRELGEKRKRNRAMRAEVRRLTRSLQTALCLDDLWRVVAASGKTFGARAVRMELTATTSKDTRALRFESGFETDSDMEVNLQLQRFNLVGGKACIGFLELAWTPRAAIGTGAADRDAEVLVEVFCDEIVESFAHIHTRDRTPSQLGRHIVSS
jgi:UDP-GlcNAc:undecaprenyl-phosphate GlcNAc-1-phosphate transferase